MISDIIVEAIASVLASIIGVNESVFKQIFIKAKLLRQNEKSSKNLSIKIEELSESLKNSSELMAEIENEFMRQKDLAEKWEAEAKTSQLIASMSQEDVDAVSKIFGRQLEQESKKNNRSSILWSTFFCIVGIVAGFLLSKFCL